MKIGAGDTRYVIAELANTHEGDKQRAISIISAVADDADAVKVQAYTADELTTPDHPNYNSFDEKSFTGPEWERIIGHAKERGLDVLADVFGTESLDRMESIGVDGYKIHASDLTNRDLLREAAVIGDPVFLSAGGSTTQEIRGAMYELDRHGRAPAALIYGFQCYPTDFDDTHLQKLQALSREFNVPIGFSPHIEGGADVATELPMWAVIAGADLLEIHVTTNRSEKPADYHSSLTPSDFQQAVENVQRVLPALGASTTEINEAERSYRTSHKKYVVVSERLEAGDRITASDVALKRVPEPAEADHTDPSDVVGRVTETDLELYTPVRDEHLSEKVAAVLACRAESDRLWAKPMQVLGDKPILQHLVDRLELIDGIHDIVLAIADTSSKSVFVNYANRNGYPYVVGSEPDVLKRLIEGANHVDADTVVRATTENPYVHWENVDDLITRHLDRDNDLTTVEEMPSGTHVEVISRSALERSHREGEDRHRSELCTLYINENPDIFDIETLEPPERLRRPEIRLTVDYPSDLILVRQVFERMNPKDRPISLGEIIGLFDENPELLAINIKNPNENRLYD